MEKRILHSIADGMTSEIIAEKLSISIRTVDTHRYNICRKLNISGNYALLKYALEHKENL